MGQDKRKTRAQLIAELEEAQARNLQAQAALQRVNRILRAIRNVNQVIARERDTQRVLQRACDSLVETQGYYGAWIALIDTAGLATNVIAAGENAAAWLNLPARNSLLACGQSALQQSSTVVVAPPAPVCTACPLFSALAAIYSDRRVMITRMEYAGQVYGVMGVLTPGTLTMDQEETDLFEEVAGDLAYALHDVELEQAHRQSEQALHLSEYKFKEFFAHMPDYAYIVSPEGLILDANESARQTLGYAREELIGQPLAKIYAPESLERAKQLFARWQESGQLTNEEITIITKEGARRTVLLNVGSVKNENGTILHSTSVQTDITERKQIEKILRASEQELQLTLDATTDGIWKWNFKTGEMSFSPMYYTMLGYEVGEFPATYESWRGLIHPDDVKGAIHTATEYLMSKPETYENKFRLRTKAGNYRWIRARARVVERDEHGNAIRMIGHHEDITERKQAEDALRESEERYRLLVETANEGVWVMDAGHVSTYVNQAMAHMLGYSPAEMLGKKVEDFFFEEDRSFHEESMRKRHAGEDEVYERRFRRKDGCPLWTLVSAKSLKDGHGYFSGSFAMFTDITERKQAEEQIKATLHENQMLLQEVHHRVRNNLQIIISLINLQSSRISDAQAHGHFKAAEGRIRAIALVQEQLHRSPDLAQVHWAIYIQRLISNLFQALRINPDIVQLEIEIGYDVTLGVNQATPCGLLINELLTNSLKHAFPNAKCNKGGKIGIQVQSEEKHMTLTIYDNGVGLPPDLDWRNPPTLGLQLVHTLARQLGATLTLDGRQGTCFTVTFETRQ